MFFTAITVNDLILLNFKTIVSTYLIERHTGRSRAPTDDKTGPKRKYQYQFEQGDLPPHLPHFQNIRRRCEYCYKDEINVKTYVKCTECGIFLYLIKERNRFKKHNNWEKDIISFKLSSYFHIIFRFSEASKTFMKSKSLSLSFAISLFFVG